MGRWEYPKSRRILMQVVLWLIFGASVGLAALVTHQHRGTGSSRLAALRYVGQIGARLPKGWLLTRENQGNILFVATEPDTAERKGRQITIRRHKTDPALAPEEFLQSSGLLQGTVRQIPTDPANNVAEPITIANLPGVMLEVKKPLGILFLPVSEYETELFAASVRPSGIAISLEFVCPDDSDPDGDLDLLQDIAGAIVVQDKH